MRIKIEVIAATVSTVIQDGLAHHQIKLDIVSQGNDMFVVLQNGQILDSFGRWTTELPPARQSLEWKRTRQFQGYLVAVSRATAALKQIAGLD